MDIKTATLEEIKAFGRVDIDGKFQIGGFVIIPRDELHDSGYRCMEFLLLDKQAKPLGIVGGGSDLVVV